jgi:uncharacterized protein DUF2585
MKEAEQKLFSRGSLLLGGSLILVLGGLLYLEGRPAWCKEGFGIWSAAWTHCTSQHVFDPYSLTHVLHGVIFYWLLRPMEARVGLRWRLVAALALEIGWELLENSTWVIERYRQETASLDYTGDSIINSLGDAASTIVGFAFASRVSWKASLAVFIVVEVGLLIFVRDNLTLNVVMLFFPLESLKDWQLGGW